MKRLFTTLLVVSMALVGCGGPAAAQARYR